MRILGLDPGLRRTGWGVLRIEGSRLVHVGHGVVTVGEAGTLAERLARLHVALADLLSEHRPDEAAVETTFVNANPTSTLKLGMARGVVMLAPALAGVKVAEYAPNLIKKSVVGSGHADKTQIQMMVRVLLPTAGATAADAADALAVAICHAHHRTSPGRASLGRAPEMARPA